MTSSLTLSSEVDDAAAAALRKAVRDTEQDRQVARLMRNFGTVPRVGEFDVAGDRKMRYPVAPPGGVLVLQEGPVLYTFANSASNALSGIFRDRPIKDTPFAYPDPTATMEADGSAVDMQYRQAGDRRTTLDLKVRVEAPDFDINVKWGIVVFTMALTRIRFVGPDALIIQPPRGFLLPAFDILADTRNRTEIQILLNDKEGVGGLNGRRMFVQQPPILEETDEILLSEMNPSLVTDRGEAVLRGRVTQRLIHLEFLPSAALRALSKGLVIQHIDAATVAVALPWAVCWGTEPAREGQPAKAHFGAYSSPLYRSLGLPDDVRDKFEGRIRRMMNLTAVQLLRQRYLWTLDLDGFDRMVVALKGNHDTEFQDAGSQLAPIRAEIVRLIEEGGQGVPPDGIRNDIDLIEPLRDDIVPELQHYYDEKWEARARALRLR